MNKEKKLLVYGIVGVVAIVLVYGFISSQADFMRKAVAPDVAAAKEVRCDILVSNPRGIPLVKNGDLVIESIQCQQQYVSNCARFGIFSDRGSLRLDGEGGLGSATDLKISEGSSESFSLGWCGSKLTNTVKAKLYNDNNELIQAKEARLT